MAFFINNKLKFRILDNINFNIDGVESLFFEISNTKVVGVVYRKPSSSITDFTGSFENILPLRC